MRARRTDANHTQIVKAFRDMGCSVLSLAQLGQGTPDLLVANYNSTVLVEVKDGSKPPSERELTPAQEVFHMNWRGKIFICKSIVEVPNIVEQLG